MRVDSPGTSPSLADRTAAVFDDNGALARALPAFEPRAAQREMAAAVASLLDSGGILLAEAGTGTGKTLAYLVPAVLKRERVLVSTGTKNLQEQIVSKDIPLLHQVLDVPFTVTCMKGRGNYLCLHRLEAIRQGAGPVLIDVATPERSAWIDRLAAWSARTETGDRSELDDMPDDLPLWHEVSATAENCLGTSCPKYHECFVTRMRQRAADSDIVVVNHHLLFADAALRQGDFGEVIPDCAHAVLDEAHQLEEIATQYFGVAVSTFGVEELAGDIERWAGASLRGQPRDALMGGADRLRRHARHLFQALSPTRGRADERARLTSDIRAHALEPGAEVCGTLEGLHGTLMLLQHASDGTAAVAANALDDLVALARRTSTLREDLRFLLEASDYEFVYFIETRGRGVHLRAAPIDVSKLVRHSLLERRQSTVLTSATLAVDGSFDFVRARLGIQQAHELRLPSEFDYRTQAILYLPRRMPAPKDAAYGQAAAREIVELLSRTRGRAFVLFTSYAMLRGVQPVLESMLPYPLLVQGTAPRGALVEAFRRTPNAVLLATSSFWQGVDVVGDALSCVIIDKLPFASPGDPVTAARLELIDNRGGDPFADYQVPLAVLTLLQGLGRLLRHRLDRGVLAVLDPRLKTMGYGRRFLASLPPAPVTSSLDDVEKFFAD